MPKDIANPVLYFDPKTKKTYTPEATRSHKFPDSVYDRLHTRVVSIRDGETIVEFPEYEEVSRDAYRRFQLEYEAFNYDADKMNLFFSTHPELIEMTPIERIDWNPITKDIYHSRETYIRGTQERNKLLAALKKKFLSKDYRTTSAYQKGYNDGISKASSKPPKRDAINYARGYKEGQDSIPKLYFYYRKRIRGSKRSNELFRRVIPYNKLTTASIRDAIAKVKDSIWDVLDYYYVVAERKSAKGDGMEYRTIVGRWNK